MSNPFAPFMILGLILLFMHARVARRSVKEIKAMTALARVFFHGAEMKPEVGKKLRALRFMYWAYSITGVGQALAIAHTYGWLS